MRRDLLRYARVVIPLAILFYFLPWIAILFVICGLLDLGRHKRITGDLAQKYFTGNGLATWLLSPFNLFFDLISTRTPYVLSLDDFSQAERQEIETVLNEFKDNKDSIIEDIRKQMDGKKRGMLFYKWYDKNTNESVPVFNSNFTYVKTVGVSVFNQKERTSLHFGPLRLTVRVLYNLTAFESDKVFIEVDGKKHFWHDDPLFIFDDTIQHRSVNQEERERYCVFVDVLRPSAYPGLQNAIMKIVQVIFVNYNAIFYKNWSLLK